MMEIVMLTAERSSVAATRDLLPLWQPGYGSIDKRSLLLMPIDKVGSQVYALLCPKVFSMVAEVSQGNFASPHRMESRKLAQASEPNALNGSGK